MSDCILTSAPRTAHRRAPVQRPGLELPLNPPTPRREPLRDPPDGFHAMKTARASRKLERPAILMVAACIPQTPPLIALAPWDTHPGATCADTSNPTRGGRVRPWPVPIPAFHAGRDPGAQAPTRHLPADFRSAEAQALGPYPLGLALPSLVRLARGFGDRQAGDSHRLAAPEVPAALGEAEPVGEAWQTCDP